MTRAESLELVLTTFIPKDEDLEDGHIYLSLEYETATHRCACGCGMKVVTPLGAGRWTHAIIDGRVTLHPSIGNFQIPCRTHYWIQDGRVVWC